MNRSHKLQLQKLKAKNDYSKEDVEIAEELLKQEDPAFNEEVEAVKHKIERILREKRDDRQKEQS